MLKRYWIEPDFSTYEEKIPMGCRMGIGVTAYTYEDALEIIKEKIFNNSSLPSILNVIENVDISNLDENQVLPNMNTPTIRGIWFPLGYE